MSVESQILEAILRWPDDERLRRAYADRCNDRDRREFIRLQSDLADAALSGFEAPLDWELREENLLEKHERSWAEPVAELADSYRFHRGFVELVGLLARTFLDEAENLFSASPIRHLDLFDGKDTLTDLLSMARLEQVRSLSLDRSGLEDHEIAALAESRWLRNLVWLSLSYNRITRNGVEALVHSPYLVNLRYVDFDGNPFDPTERMAQDQGVVTDIWLPPDGIVLEERVGHRVSWLHRDAATFRGQVLGRFELADLAAREQAQTLAEVQALAEARSVASLDYAR
ncbi:MAG TPA: hypothetical protein VEW48_02000 [Thermoanaerobaculia bacterium]|nr:hypothetical protein [Thermoanaerobaculia bacterium]